MSTLQKEIVPRLFKDGKIVLEREFIHLLIDIIGRIDGSLPGTGTFSKLILNSLTDGKIPYHVSDAAGLADSPIIYSGGLVGVGTLTPTSLLDVKGDAATDVITSDIGFNIYPVPVPDAVTGVLNAGAELEIGTYRYYVTYLTDLGESENSAIYSIVTTSSNQRVLLTIPVSTDPRVTGRKLYRTKVGGVSYSTYVLATVANNTETTYLDVIPDASLTVTGVKYGIADSTSKYILVNGVQAVKIAEMITSFGINAGASASGAWSSIFGFDAGRYLTSGTGNSFFGYYAGRLGTTGASNVYFGFQAGYRNNGNYNVLAGYNAGAATATFTFNIGVGVNALGIATGSYNTVIGGRAGYSIIAGTYNTFAGYNSGYHASQLATATNSMALGNGTYTTKSNQVVIGNASIVETLLQGLVGIGITPTARLHLPAGTIAAGTAPLKFTSGTVLTSPEPGAAEFLTDDFSLTITTGSARKGIVLNDGANLTSGKIPIASTNGRLIDGPTPLAGTKTYYVADTFGGATTKKLTFVDGILVSETHDYSGELAMTGNVSAAV